MSEVRVDTGATCFGQPSIFIRTAAWRIVVLPTLGGKIWRLEYNGFEFLWHNPRLEPRAVPADASYDDNWAGGWDEIFPCDAPYGDFPDHGEFWNALWDFELLHEGPDIVLHMWATGRVTGSRFDKWMRIPPAGSKLEIRYRISNPNQTFPFLFKQHPAFRASNGARVVLPPCRFTPDTEFSTSFRTPGQSFPWPEAQKADGASIDLRQVQPPESCSILFGHAAELKGGYCGIFHPERGLGLALLFSEQALPYCWIFASYGGFQGHQVVVLEPCTADSWRLETALENGSARRLENSQPFEVTVSVVAAEAATDEEFASLIPD